MAMKALLQSKSDIYSPNIDGETPIIAAVKAGNLECVKLLVQAGASLRFS